MNEFSTPLRYAAMLVLFLLVWALMFRPIQKQMTASLKELGGGKAEQMMLEKASVKAELAPATAALGLEADPESAGIKQELNELILAEPASMTRTLQSWLRESNG